MLIILKETVESLGLAGSEVKVAAGYARNYLFPQGKAVLATPGNRQIIEQSRAKIELRIAKEKAKATEDAQKIEGVSCKITAKVSAEGKLYGSVTIGDIVEALAGQGVVVSKKMVLLKESIKEIGTYQVGIYLYEDVIPEVVVEIAEEED